MTSMDRALNVAFFVLHSAWIALTCFGWVSPRTRGWQLAAVSLTVASWFGLGLVYGWGYCPCTDWHWQVRARLGFVDPPSYVQLLIREATGFDPGPAAADTIAVIALSAAAVLGVRLRLRDRRREATRRSPRT
jgi:Protein of Unknown function (DUF2784)